MNLAGAATLEAIRSQLSARPDVKAVQIFQNNSAVEVNDRPPHSIEALVQGDSDADIAAALFAIVGAGITFFGTTMETIIDSEGQSQVIRFSRPVAVPVFVEFTVTVTTDYPADGDEQIKNAIIAWGENAPIGGDIILMGTNAISCVIDDIAGITNLVIRIGRAADMLENNNLAISASELPTFDIQNVTVIRS